MSAAGINEINTGACKAGKTFPLPSPEPRIDPRLWETLCRRTCAVRFLWGKNGYLNLTAPAHSSC